MDEYHRTGEVSSAPVSSNRERLGAKVSADPAAPQKSNSSSASAVNPVIHTFKQFQEFLSTASVLGVSIILRIVWHWLNTKTMGKSFDPAKDIQGLEGKVVLVTGGNAGLGKQTIAYLAAHKPARIYLAARTASKAKDAISDIQAAVPNACEIVHLPLDLTSFSSIAEAVDIFKARESRLDILINNAGVMALPYSTTKEGYEIQFGTNHMGHALLTKLLLPTMLDTAKLPGADVRIISLSSMGHYITPPKGIELDQAALEKILTWRRYGNSKLANVLYAKELAERYPSITSISLHPGVIVTDLYSGLQSNIFLKVGVWIYRYLAMILPGHYKDAKGGSLNSAWAAAVPKDELQNGAFYVPVGLKHDGSGYAKDKGLQKKLWEYTDAELIKQGY